MCLVGLVGLAGHFSPASSQKSPGEKNGSILDPFWFLFDSILALWTCLVPGGGPGADEGEMLRNAQLHLAPFWSQFWRKMLIF